MDITKGTKAPQAAGKIHTDFERGFIRAEVVAYDDLIECGSHNASKGKGINQGWKAKTTSYRTEISCCSASTYRKEDRRCTELLIFRI